MRQLRTLALAGASAVLLMSQAVSAFACEEHETAALTAPARSATANYHSLTVAKKAVKDAFNVKYFDGSDNITQEVRTSGHNFKLEAGAATKFKAQIKIKEEGLMCFMAEVNHPSAGDANAFVTVNTDC